MHGAVARLAEGTYRRIPEARKARARCIAPAPRGGRRGRCGGEPPRCSPSSTWSATRTSPTCSSTLAATAAGSSPSGRAPSRSLTRHCCGNGRAPASGIDQDYACGVGFGVPPDPSGGRLGCGGARPGRALSRARLAAALDWSADHAPRAERARARVRHREPGRVGAGRRSMRGAPTWRLLGSARRGRAPPGRGACLGHPRARAAARGRAPRRRPRSRSVSPRQLRSSMTTSTAHSCSPVRRSRSTTRRRRAAPLLAVLLRAPKTVGIMNGPDHTPSPQRRSHSALTGRTLAVTDFYNEIFFVDARTLRADRRAAAPGSRVDTASLHGPSGMLAYGGRRLHSAHRPPYAPRAGGHLDRGAGEPPRVHARRVEARRDVRVRLYLNPRRGHPEADRAAHKAGRLHAVVRSRSFFRAPQAGTPTPMLASPAPPGVGGGNACVVGPRDRPCGADARGPGRLPRRPRSALTAARWRSPPTAACCSSTSEPDASGWPEPT